jgi:hypothetical protein
MSGACSGRSLRGEIRGVTRGVRNVTPLALCVALAANACAGGLSVAPRANAAAQGVTEAQPQPEGTKESAQEPPPSGYAEAVRGTSAPPDPHRLRRIYGYVGLAIGAEAAVVAVVTSFMLLHQKSVIDGDCDAQKRCSSVGLAETGAVSQTSPLNTTAWIVAAVGLGAGTLLLLTSQPESGKSTTVTVSPSLGGAALGLRSTF